MIYIIRAGASGPVKIGFTDNIDSRFAKMQVDNHEALTIIRLLEGDEIVEASLHDLFADMNIRGEWFGFSTRMLGDLGFVDLPLPQPITERRVAERLAAPVPEPVVVGDDQFALRLRWARQVARLTQADLAAMMSVHQSAIAQWEAGTARPRGERLLALARALGVSVETLFVAAGAPTAEAA